MSFMASSAARRKASSISAHPAAKLSRHSVAVIGPRPYCSTRPPVMVQAPDWGAALRAFWVRERNVAAVVDAVHRGSLTRAPGQAGGYGRVEVWDGAVGLAAHYPGRQPCGPARRAMLAIPAGFEPAISTVTGWRGLRSSKRPVGTAGRCAVGAQAPLIGLSVLSR